VWCYYSCVPLFLHPGRRTQHQEDFYGLAHAFPETEEEEEGDFVPWIELAYPEPKTIRQLRTYVHELAHLRRRHYPRAESDEFSAAEAD